MSLQTRAKGVTLRNTERALRPDVSQWVVQALTRLLGTYAIFNGVAIIAGGRQRWLNDSSMATAMNVPGAPATWGVALGLLGLMTVGGTFLHARGAARLVVLGTVGVAAWCLFFAATVVLSAVHDPDASTTGIATYLVLAITGCTLAVAYLQSRHET